MEPQPNFQISGDISLENGKLVELFNEAAKAKALFEDLKEKLDEAEKEYKNYETLLITAIQETGGMKVEFEPKVWAKITEKYEFSFVKMDRKEALEWVEQEGADDIITIPWQSLQGFINNRFRLEKEKNENLLKRLPGFINPSKKTKLSLSTKAVNQFRGK